MTSTRAPKGYRKCQRCQKNRQLRFYKTKNGRICNDCQKKRRTFTTKGARLEATYGITLDEWQAMLEAQGGCCAVCGGKRSTYDVDHDHKMEKELRAMGLPDLVATRMSVRGLLCKRCNRRLLPASLDSQVILTKAMEYLSSPPAQWILSGTLPSSDTT